MIWNRGETPGPSGHRFWPAAIRCLMALVILPVGLWGAAAIWYRFPGGLPVRAVVMLAWLLASLAAAGGSLFGQRRAILAWLCVLVPLLTWWHGIVPSNQRDWSDDVKRPLTGHVQGDMVTLNAVRDFDWRSDSDYTAYWEPRTYDLKQLRSVDVALSYWMGPAIAHTLVSFGFDHGRFITFSVEIRKERGENYSALAGFFKQYEMSLVAADERDILRVRTNIRGEDVHLYRVHMPESAMRSLFLSYVATANELASTPRFYNTLTANCTTIVYEMAQRIVPGLPLDARLLASGYLPSYLYDVGALTPGYTLARLQAAGRITDLAKAADRSPDFSEAIRRDLPGAMQTPPDASFR